MDDEKICIFIKDNLNINDQEVVEYMLFLIRHKRLFEIEPLLERADFVKLMSIAYSESEPRNLFIRRDEPRFLKDFKDNERINNHPIAPSTCNTRDININKPLVYRMNADLPVFAYEKAITEALVNNKVILIEGGTGCGKSTQIPKFLLNYFDRIIVSQPRRIAASNLARRVSLEINESVGCTVGYKVRFDEKSSSKTRLKFVTDGVLLQEREAYDLIIIDEVHERKLNTDIFFAVMNKYQYSRLILMSATVNSYKFINFFKCANIIIEQKRFSNDIHYLPFPCYDFVRKIVEQLKIVLSNARSSINILVFLSGMQDIDRCFNLIKSQSFETTVVLKSHSAVSFQNQQKIFKKYDESKIILSTNIAETSITIEDLDVVIDSGFVKQKRMESGIERLEMIRISKEQADQRSGRVGRTKRGAVYRMYTQSEFSAFHHEGTAEIMNANLGNLILVTKSLGIQHIQRCRFLERPPLENFIDSLERLYRLGALDDRGSLTELGREVARLPLEPELAISLLKAFQLEVFVEVATICALLSVRNLFNHSNIDEYEEVKKTYGDTMGDFFFLMNVYQNAIKRGEKYAIKNKINFKVVSETKHIVQQLCSLFRGHEVKRFQIDHSSRRLRIIKSFCAGYFLNTARKTGASFRTFWKDEEVCVHPSSALNTSNAEYILYTSIIFTDRTYAKNCVKVRKEDLIEASSMFRPE